MSTVKSFMLSGLVPATFTPMKENGDVDYDRIETYAQYLADSGLTQIFANGSTGEGFSLTLEERKKVVEKWINVGKKSGRIKSIVVQVGAMNVHDSIVLAKHATEVGADAIATVPPLFFKPKTIDNLIKYCKEVAAAAPNLPFYFYHLPTIVGVELNMEDFLVAVAKEIPTLAGVKFSSIDLVDMIGCVHVEAPNRENKRLNIMFGCDQILIAGLVMGADGGVGSTYNYMPGLLKRMLKNLEAKNIEEARKDQYRHQQSGKVMCKYADLLGGNVAAVKAIMALCGMDPGPARSPLRPPTASEQQSLKSDLTKIGFFDWKD